MPAGDLSQSLPSGITNGWYWTSYRYCSSSGVRLLKSHLTKEELWLHNLGAKHHPTSWVVVASECLNIGCKVLQVTALDQSINLSNDMSPMLNASHNLANR